MTTSLAFALLIELIKVVEPIPFPAELFNRHRMQYDSILGQLCLSSSKGESTSVTDLTTCPILGSQPTANKRFQELISYGLIESREGEDRRQKFLSLTTLGRDYLEACSEAMSQVVHQQKVNVPPQELGATRPLSPNHLNTT